MSDGPAASPTPRPLEPPHYGQIVASLLDQGWRPGDIAALTDRQLIDYLFRPRDDKGEPQPVPKPDSGARNVEREKAEFMAIGTTLLAMGAVCDFTYADLEKKWQEGERRRAAREPAPLPE